jgi:hypothetical protein
MQATIKNESWGGYWWSMLRGETALGWDDKAGRKVWSEKEAQTFTSCLDNQSAPCLKFMKKISTKNGLSLSPLMKYDLYALEKLKAEGKPYSPLMITKSVENELKIHYIGDNTNHPHWESQGYAGKCIGWGLSTMFYPEPTKTKIINGIVFNPTDIKAILATLYNGAQFFTPENGWVGEAYRGGNTPDAIKAKEDVYPHEFIKALQDTIGKGQALVADLDSDIGVWNHPVFAYDLSYEKINSKTAIGKLKIKYADDQVGIDLVFTGMRERLDHKDRHYEFELKIPAKWDGDISKIKESQWLGESIENHPDSLILTIESDWRKNINQYSGSLMKNEVNFQLLKKNKVGNKWEHYVDHLLKEYYKK